jgi:hypothetical protein
LLKIQVNLYIRLLEHVVLQMTKLLDFLTLFISSLSTNLHKLLFYKNIYSLASYLLIVSSRGMAKANWQLRPVPIFWRHFMRMRNLLLVVGLVVICAGQAWAIPLTVGGSPQLFEFTGGTGFIDNPSGGYQLTLSGSARIDLTDRLMIGDQYRLYVNSALMLTTSAINVSLDGDQTGTTTFAAAWANPYLSKGSLLLGAGTYQLDIEAIRVAAGVNYGSGFIRAVSVPEPNTLLMLGMGILLLGLFQYNRKATATNN